MKRVVSVYLPTWPTDRIRRRNGWRFDERREPAILLIAVDRGKQIVAERCAQSRAQGVQRGMTLTEARSLLGRMQVIEAPHEPQRDAAGLRGLASWAIQLAPVVADDPPDGLLLDVTGCQRLYRGERRLLNAIGNGLERLGIANRIACAPTVGCAWAVARYGEHDRAIVDSGDERAAIEALPIEALRIDTETARGLHEVNVDRIGQVLDIPRLELAMRFDSSLLRRVDQALSETPEIIEALQPREPITVERNFDGAVANLEALLIVGRELIDEMSASLTRAESGATRIELVMQRLDATPIRLAIRLSRPSRGLRHLWSLLRPRIETVNMGYGIERMALTVCAAQRIAHEQQAQWPGQSSSNAETERAAGELIDTLSHRLGAERALCASLVESHRPERVAQFSPAMMARDAKPSQAAVVNEDRPSVLLEPPERIDVMAVTPEGPPIMLRWRGHEHRIAATHGPQRINCEWWRLRNDAASSEGGRDYFKVQDESGRWLWVFCEQRTGQWFLHGEWA